MIEGKYLLYEKTGIIIIAKDKIKTDNEYYLNNIKEKHSENKNIYKEIKFQYLVNEKGI